jgi:hypothetical protein
MSKTTIIIITELRRNSLCDHSCLDKPIRRGLPGESIALLWSERLRVVMQGPVDICCELLYKRFE